MVAPSRDFDAAAYRGAELLYQMFAELVGRMAVPSWQELPAQAQDDYAAMYRACVIHFVEREVRPVLNDPSKITMAAAYMQRGLDVGDDAKKSIAVGFAYLIREAAGINDQEGT